MLFRESFEGQTQISARGVKNRMTVQKRISSLVVSLPIRQQSYRPVATMRVHNKTSSTLNAAFSITTPLAFHNDVKPGSLTPVDLCSRL